MSSIKRNFAYNSVLTVSNYIINLVIFPYCARVLGVERLGTVNFAQNIVQYFLFIAMMGITHVGVREIAKQTNQNDRNSCFSSMLGLNFIYTAISLAIYIPLIFLIDRFVEIQTLFFLGGLQILFTTFTVEWFFRGIEDFRYITIRTVIIKVLYVISVFIFVHGADDYIAFFLLTVLMTITNAVINYVYARKKVRFSWKLVNFHVYLKSTLSLGAYSILTSMYTTFNVAFLGLVWDDIQVGYYTTALKLYTIILGFYSAFTTVMLPKMTSLSGSEDRDSFNNLIHKSFELLYTIAIPMVFALFVLAPELITLLAGNSYAPASNMSRIVVPMLFVVGVAQVLSFQILIPKGFDKLTLYASIIGAIVGVTANLLFTTRFAALGTCVVVAITETSVTGYYLFVSIRKGLVDIEFRLFLRHLFASLPYIVLCMLPKIMFANNYIYVLGLSFVLCAAYFIVSQMYILKNDLILSFVSKLDFRNLK